MASLIPISQYRAELAKAETELAELTKQRVEIAEKENDLLSDVRALKQLITSQEKRLGIPLKETESSDVPQESPTEKLAPPNKSKAPKSTTLHGYVPAGGAASEAERLVRDHISKAEYVRGLLRKKPGMTAREIREATGRPFDLSKNFPYTMLYGWKQAGKVREEGGHYYLIKDAG